MEEDNLVHADASPALSQNGQQTSVQTGKTRGQISYETAQTATLKMLRRSGVTRDFAPMTWEEIGPDLQAIHEIAADAVIEECAKVADEQLGLWRDSDPTVMYIAAAIRSLKSSPGRVVDRTASTQDQHPVEPNNLGDPQ